MPESMAGSVCERQSRSYKTDLTKSVKGALLVRGEGTGAMHAPQPAALQAPAVPTIARVRLQ